MEKDRAQNRAESLEKTIQNHTLYLKKAVEEFQKKCLSIFPLPFDTHPISRYKKEINTSQISDLNSQTADSRSFQHDPCWTLLARLLDFSILDLQSNI
jgi:hypothetical protein